MTLILALVLAGAIFTGLLSLFWTIRIVRVALSTYPATSRGGLLLLLSNSVTAVFCIYLITTALSLAGLI